MVRSSVTHDAHARRVAAHALPGLRGTRIRARARCALPHTVALAGSLSRTQQEVLLLRDQRLRVSEILQGNCQLDELIEWRGYARNVLQVSVRFDAREASFVSH